MMPATMTVHIRKFTGLLTIFIVSFMALVTVSCKKEKPNVVFILTDQWRASAFGYAGNPIVKTPHIDRFAGESVNFANAVSVCPVCTPYRASLITGRYPTSTGMFLNDLCLPSSEICMAEIYQSEGYRTAYIGKWHLDGHGREDNVAPERRQGFEYWKGMECSHDYNRMAYYENNDPEKKYWEGYSSFAESKDAQQYLEKHARDKKPFLLFVSFATPHFPHNTAPQEFKDLYPYSKIKPDPNIPDTLKDLVLPELQGYYAHCTATDKAIGDLINKIEALGLSDNTIVVFTSDHGEMMGAHGRLPFRKQLAWDESARIPFLIRVPHMEKNMGKRINAPLTTPEILPTLLGLCSINIPKSIEGRDLSRMIRSADPHEDRAALFMSVCPFDVNYPDKEYRAIRTARYTYARTPVGPFMLFDDQHDPYQMNNLVDKPEYAGLQKELENSLNKELEYINDVDFKPRDFYLKKWGLELNKDHIIEFRSIPGHINPVCSPELH
jgi:arylsulfatase A-like enzyme